MPVNELDGFATIRVNLAQFAELIETKKINASNIAPVFWDGDSWSDPTAYPPCRLNPEVPGCDWSITDDTLTITLDHLSDFAVTGPASQGIDGIFLPLILNAFQSGTPGEEPTEPITPTTPVTLTLLHNNDGETGLLPTTSSVGDDEVQVGGIAAFKTVTEREIAEAQGSGNAVVNVYAGDSFLASATLQCSFPIDSDKTIFDAVGQQQIPYTAHILGNHEFDYTPDFLERFINAFAEGGQVTQPFLSANLDFSGEPAFDSLVDADGLIEGMPADGRPIGKSMIVTDETTGEQFGIVGATTSNLANISSPRNVTASDEAPAVQAEIDRLLERGVNKIIFVSHLQDVDNDIDLISQVEGIDVAVAGGGDDFLVSSAVDQDAQLLPGMSADEIEGDYPRVAQDAAGRDVYIVTSIDKYRFLGRLDVAFDAQGEVTSVLEETSYPRRVVVQDAVTDGLGVTDAVVPDAGLVSSVNDEVEACLQELADTTIATTEVLLDVSRDGVRGGENAMGNLVADSFMFVYDRYAEATGLPAHAVDNPVVALQNGGGIRQNAGDVLPRDGQVPGPITQLDTIDVLPFDNFISVVPEVTPADLLEILDNRGTSGINHVANLKLVYNTTTNDEGETIYAIDSITLINADGSEQPLVEGGAVVDGAPNITVVTNSFVAANEFEAYPDQVFLVDADGFKLLYEQPLREYLLDLGTIATDDQRYQEGGEGRIIIQPATSR
jgi:5'-nucleotidase